MGRKLHVTRHAAYRWGQRGSGGRGAGARLRSRDSVRLPGELAEAMGHPGGRGVEYRTTGAEVLLTRQGAVVTVLPLPLEELAQVLVWALCGVVV